MVKLLNPSGGITWVHESRLEEYKARGFTEAPRLKLPEKPKARKRKTGG